MITSAEFSTFVLSLRKALPKFAPSFEDESVLAIWYQAFVNYTMEDLRAVYVVCRNGEKEFPTIARLLELLDKAKPTSALSFDQLVDLIAQNGAYRAPIVDPTTGRIIERLGGWQAICDWSNDELPFRRKEYNSAFADVRSMEGMGRFKDPKSGPILVGLHSSEQSTRDPIKALPAKRKFDPYTSQDWDIIRAVHKDDLIMSESPLFLDHGLFKLYSSRDELWYSYKNPKSPMKFFLVPGRDRPYPFVESDKHIQEVKGRVEHQTSYDPNRFNSERYSIHNWA